MVLPQLLDNQVFLCSKRVLLNLTFLISSWHSIDAFSGLGLDVLSFSRLCDSLGELGQLSTMLCWQCESRPPGPQEDRSQSTLLKENWETVP